MRAIEYFLTLLLFLFLYQNFSYSQVAYNPRIDSVISLVSLPNLIILNRELTGDTSTIIGGSPYTIVSRHWQNPSNEKAAQYIYEKFQSYGLSTRYQTYRTSGVNVISTKIGSKYPNQQYIICGHYDSMPPGPLAPGADDNGSGACTVLEAARIFSSIDLYYTIIFIAFDEEEFDHGGSIAYSDSAFANGDSLLGVLNLDMIAWNYNNNPNYGVSTDTNSNKFSDDLIATGYYYQPSWTPIKDFNFGGSDHESFWQNGFVAIFQHENFEFFNPYWHTVDDKFSNLYLSYFHNMAKIAIGFLASIGWDYRIDFTHIPIENSFDTTSKIATAVINSAYKVALGVNSPRLYYRVGTGQFTSVSAFYNNLDTFKFVIPGQPPGTTVSYYLAAQDSAGNMIGTLPSGGKGFNPPGTFPPPNLFSYKIFIMHNQCSNTLPKPILDWQITVDTINITQNGIIDDLNVNLTLTHTHVGDLLLLLIGPVTPQVTFSSYNGGSGQNYTNTTFDDEASVPITQGTPPFTGSFIPEQPLSQFDGESMNFKWILKIFDNKVGDQGTLENWCLNIRYSNPISVIGKEIPVEFKLSQNYPNPFNSSTKINYSLGRNSNVRIIIYDALGREISTLINGNLAMGNYTSIFSSNNLSSGMYYYSMYINGELFKTKKMAIIK